MAFGYSIVGLALAFMGLAGAAQAAPQETEADAYTWYELLAPGSGKFRILYDVTATTPGALVYDNPIRRGSHASDETVTDRASERHTRPTLSGLALAAATSRGPATPLAVAGQRA